MNEYNSLLAIISIESETAAAFSTESNMSSGGSEKNMHFINSIVQNRSVNAKDSHHMVGEVKDTGELCTDRPCKICFLARNPVGRSQGFFWVFILQVNRSPCQSTQRLRDVLLTEA